MTPERLRPLQLKQALTSRKSQYTHRRIFEQDVWGEKKHQSASVALIHARKLLGVHTLHLTPQQTSYIGATLLHLVITQAVVPKCNANPTAWKAALTNNTALPSRNDPPAFHEPIPWLLQVSGACALCLDCPVLRCWPLEPNAWALSALPLPALEPLVPR